MHQFEIKHHAYQALFLIELNEGDKALLRYRIIEPQSDRAQIDFYSTFVPDLHRGKGLAAKLVEHGFAWAEENKLAIKASCWYAAKKMADRAKQAPDFAE